MKEKAKIQVRWLLFGYDTMAYMILFLFFFRIFEINQLAPLRLLYLPIGFVCITALRVVFQLQKQIWRYGNLIGYCRLFVADMCALAFQMFLACLVLPQNILLLIAVSLANILVGVLFRIIYALSYSLSGSGSWYGTAGRFLLKSFAGVERTSFHSQGRIRIAIIGAGTIGVNLFMEFLANPGAHYETVCFLDNAEEKIGRTVQNLPIFSCNEAGIAKLMKLNVQEVIIAVPDMSSEEKRRYFELLSHNGFRVRVYDFPLLVSAKAKRQLREYDIEELLFRKRITVMDERTKAYYLGKTVLVTGGGGSIGSELCRQLAGLSPKKIVILDVCENGAYEVQQELRGEFGSSLDIRIEIVSVTNREGVERVFREHHPDIVIHAAAHKHVPLMEKNCVEAVENNVFGTFTVLKACEKFHARRFMMVSTDKAVNPTNVMGTTKRLCEMIVLSACTNGNLQCSVTRFGNVLGSAGSVIPLFKRQIASGGPITVTDRRITRYFMMIPEAAQLVLQSGALAKNGELFVLDMGNPVRIWDLAENMIRLSGADHVDIVETGLRPGEKLYEELLVKTEELEKTENDLIFIERDSPVSQEKIEEILCSLKEACASNDDEVVRSVLHQAVPSFHSPEEVNPKAEKETVGARNKIPDCMTVSLSS